LSADELKLKVVIGRYYIDPAKLESLVDKFLNLANLNHRVVEKKFVNLKKEDRTPNNSEEWITKSSPYFDFSAYQELEVHPSDESYLYLVINDTLFVRHPYRYISAFLRDNLDIMGQIDVPAAMGIVYPYNEVIARIDGVPVIDHITTYCFALNSKAAHEFQDLLAVLPAAEAKKDQLAWILNYSSHNAVVKLLVDIHLGAVKTSSSYKNGQSLSESQYIGKAISVILEYALSRRILMQGGLLLPIERGLAYRVEMLLRTSFSKIRHGEYYSGK